MFGDITSLFAVSKGLAMRGIRTELRGSAGVGCWRHAAGTVLSGKRSASNSVETIELFTEGGSNVFVLRVVYDQLPS